MTVPPVISGGGGEPQFQRLHPLTIAVEFVNVISRFALAIVFFIVLWVMDGQRDTTELLLAGLGAFAVVASVIHYLTFSYAVHHGTLLIRSGLFTKQNRTIPLDRIQNINVQRNLVHRFLGLVDLQIETAAGTGSEASLGSLAEDVADQLKAVLLGHGRGGAPIFTVASTKPKKIVYAASAKELFLAGATENRALAMVAGVAGFVFAVPGMRNRVERIFEDVVNGYEATPTTIAWAIIALLLVGWIVSIVTTFVRYWDFQVEEGPGGRIVRHYGLFNQIETVLPIKRVQIVTLDQSLLQRLFRVGQMHVHTAGSFSEQDMGGRAIVSPLLADAAFPRLARAVYPDDDLSHVAWRTVSPRAVMSMVRARLLWCFLLGAGVTWGMRVAGLDLHLMSFAGLPASVETGVMVAVVLLLLALLDAWVTYRVTRYADLPDTVCARGGLFTRRSVYIPVDKIQVVDLLQSPVQRRLELASLRILTAQGGAEVPDLSAPDARALADSLHARSMASSRRLADGL